MTALANTIIVAVLLLNLCALGTSRLSGIIRVVAAQGALLGLLPLLGGHALLPRTCALAIGMMLLKGLAIPAMLRKALRDVQIHHEVEPLLGLLPTVLIGALATGVALFFTQKLPLLPEHSSSLLAPASFSTIVAGFLLLTTRVKAISQVLGYLLLENGIYLFGLLLVEAMPFMVELGILLDLFVAIFVVSIILNHIKQAFTSLDTRRFSALKD